MQELEFVEFEIVCVAEKKIIGETGLGVLQLGNIVTLEGYIHHDERDTERWVVVVSKCCLFH